VMRVPRARRREAELRLGAGEFAKESERIGQ
jgi:hypothetical protein